MKINLNQNLVDLDGKKIPDAMMNKILAVALQNARSGDSLKLWDWAVKLHKGDTLDLDPSDFTTLKTFVESESTFFTLTKAQILTVLLDTSNKK